jgi:hypothetical protein
MAKAVKKTAKTKSKNPFAKGAKGKDDKKGKKGFVPFGKKKGKK